MANGVRKLRSFMRDIDDAPRAIQTKIVELEVLTGMLEELQRESLVRPPAVFSASVEQCVALCRLAAQDIQSVVDAFGINLNHDRVRRKWNAVKAALKKSELEAFQQRLNQAQTMLNLAINCFTM